MRSRKSNDKKTISKKNIAIIQLRDAIRLYYDKSYISSITLGAAAEEILGKLSDEKYSRQLGRPVKYNYADDAAFLIAHFIPNGDIDLTTLTEEEQEQYYDDIQRQFISDRNKTRNKLKHSHRTGVSTFASRTSPSTDQSLQKSFHLSHADKIEIKKNLLPF
jgi:hypothetical protein